MVSSFQTGRKNLLEQKWSSGLENKMAALASEANGINNDTIEENGNSIGNRTYLKKSEQDIAGIGGQGGIVYDINKVKRNRVQETVKAYKLELLDLLGTPSTAALTAEEESYSSIDSPISLWPGISLEDMIEAKISALVEVNPVTTTTDSNLLEGQWELAYEAENATEVLQNSVPLFSSRSVVLSAKSKQRQASTKNSPLSSKGRTGLLFKSSTREFFLENIEKDEDSYVEDKSRRFGGLLVIKRQYEISKLTKTSLDLRLRHCNADIGYLPVVRDSNGKRDEKKRLFINILYLDSDLCVCIVNNRYDPNQEVVQSNEGSLEVYTKSEKWTGAKERVRRKVCKSPLLKYSFLCFFCNSFPFHFHKWISASVLFCTLSLFLRKKVRFFLAAPRWISSVRSPFQIREKLSQWLRKPMEEGKDTSKMFFKKDFKTSKVKMLKFGSTENEEEPSWEGDEDPFVTLDPVSRQQRMRSMKLSEIEQARKEHKKKSPYSKQNNRRPRKLKKPPSSF